MSLKLFLSILCLLVFPILSIAQSFEDPLGQINNSVHDVTKVWIQYLAIGLFSIALIIYVLRKEFNPIVILLLVLSLILIAVRFIL